MAYRDGYSSDDSTIYSRGSGQRRRRSSPSDYSRRPRRSRRHASPPRDEKRSSTAGNFVKLGLGVALVQIVATCLSKWMQDKHEANEREYLHEKRRAFEKAKAKRRREEEEHEKRREQEEDESGSDWDEREIIIREGRRIGYVPADVSHARNVSDDGEVRRIEPAPDDYHDYEHSDDDWEEERRRAPSVAARSRSRFGRTRSVPGLKSDRSRSRPAERVT